MGNPKRIVILGAGYGGLAAALRLQKKLRRGEAEVTLVNKHDYHTLTTHLHKSAAGTDHPDNARVDLKEMLNSRRTRLLKAEVQRLEPTERKVVTDRGVLRYDYLIAGLGSEPEMFGIPGLKEHALTIRSTNSVRLIRQHIRYMLAKYKTQPKRLDYLTFVVGGAGFTGTEFAGELADKMPELCRLFDVDPSLVRICSIEAGAAPLPPGMPRELVRYGMEKLTAKGVSFKLTTSIRECTPEGVRLSDGEFIPAGTVIWAAGVRGNRLLEEAGFETARGRVAVDPCLRSRQHREVFIVGDSALVLGPSGTPYPPTAQIAVQQGRYAADSLLAQLHGRRLPPFRYDHRGTVATLGRAEAIGVVGGRAVTGLLAYVLKLLADAGYLFTIGGLPLVLRKTVFRRS
ncbi:NAD(P)/FAD-dependent oxidoreductase [Paenibacillus aurantius]|uniref:NAD(P)/FAD-dependent oxidoreductase n=1 Tax=Paenibacillus aurantius TaxID=2918900 RepID=A0AA96LJ68_9BACL|nr:NAD(P)/FAD-dependent oxidoreductase [Paenibacillus aurantius]WNQ14318.1 NAD(P)/FAD-dependent oxidoreductase [Paenibacillus aurantius]